METVVDTADFHKYDLKRYRWYAHKGTHAHTYYVQTNLPRESGKQKHLTMHQLLTGGKGFDHIDRNGLNARRSNLRPATGTQQKANQKMQSNNTTGERGTSFHKPSGKYCARVQVNGKEKHLGYFTNLEEASAVAAAARAAAFGAFAA
jgi:hypothetical protein